MAKEKWDVYETPEDGEGRRRAARHARVGVEVARVVVAGVDEVDALDVDAEGGQLGAARLGDGDVAATPVHPRRDA